VKKLETKRKWGAFGGKLEKNNSSHHESKVKFIILPFNGFFFCG
jgi:hypothetical protein